jgi:3-hydroxyacyl-CoA dehydrogenase / enoyl-CoA hydratase / 3-hydroxybutyryl-CoA epimerase
MTHLTTVRDDTGIAVVTWNTAPLHQPNTFHEQSTAEFRAAIESLLADQSVTGIVITSAKSDFIVGADLAMLAQVRTMTRAQLFDRVRALQQLFRAIETGGKPVVAAINGTAVGGGLELCMACHVRVARRSGSGCPRSDWAFSRAPAARSGCRVSSGLAKR